MTPIKIKDTRAGAKPDDWGLWIDTVVVREGAEAVIIYNSRNDVVLRPVETMKVLELPPTDSELSDYLTARRAMERANGNNN